MKIKFEINGMSCGHCVKAVEQELAKLDLKSYNVAIGSAVVEYDAGSAGDNEVINAISEAGYEVTNKQIEKEK